MIADLFSMTVNYISFTIFQTESCTKSQHLTTQKYLADMNRKCHLIFFDGSPSSTFLFIALSISNHNREECDSVNPSFLIKSEGREFIEMKVYKAWRQTPIRSLLHLEEQLLKPSFRVNTVGGPFLAPSASIWPKCFPVLIQCRKSLSARCHGFIVYGEHHNQQYKIYSKYC